MQGWTGLRRFLFGISPLETSFDRRGFRGGSPDVRARLEQIGRAFLHGYHAALESTATVELTAQLSLVENERRGWAYEGAAMGLVLLDELTPSPGQRFSRFHREAGDAHTYLLHVGAGWAMARLPWGRRAFDRLDPLLRWLAIDGYGFHQAYFDPTAIVDARHRPRWAEGTLGRVFDQGVGRCLWFVDGVEVDRIAATVKSFEPERRDDLWSGVGLAATYAGGASASELDQLLAAARGSVDHLRQGMAFGAEARRRAANLSEATEETCRILGGTSAGHAARVTREALDDVSALRGHAGQYQAWREAIRKRFRVSVDSSLEAFAR